LYALGKIKIAQSDFPTATWYLRRALAQLTATVGETHFRTGNVKQKLADLCIYDGYLEEARRVKPYICDSVQKLASSQIVF
jgi:hypothetical protein